MINIDHFSNSMFDLHFHEESNKKEKDLRFFRYNTNEKDYFLERFYILKQRKKAISTQASQAVPHLSTNCALSRLTSEFEWDPVRLA